MLASRRTLQASLAVASVTTVALALWMVAIQEPYILLDWLTNYESGFVRRGLIGQVLLTANRVTGLSLVALLSSTLTVSYLAFFWWTYQIVHRVEDKRPIVLLIYSPFLFFFQVNDPLGGFRKEVLFLGLFAFMCSSCVKRRDEAGRFKVLVFGILMLAPLTLSHEMLFLFGGYLLFFLAFVRISIRRSLVLGFATIPSILAFVAILMRPGTAAQRSGICAPLRAVLPPSETLKQCEVSGAIAWLGLEPDYGISKFLGDPGPARTIGPVLMLVLLALGPIAASCQSLWVYRSRERLWAAIAVIVSMVLTIPLFLVALDWGRFVYIHAVVIGLILMTLLARSETSPGTPSAGIAVHDQLLAGTVVAYFTLWNIHHWNGLVGPGPIFSLLSWLVEFT
jgi:hypothetical protein